jgi:hypothetical protein
VDLTAPRISVLVPALRGLGSVRAALGSWEAQTRRAAIEVLVLCPDAAGEHALPAGVRVVDTTGLGLHEARARAVRAAHGEHVMIAEDHCLPDVDAVEHLLAALDDGWDVVVPALRSADPRTMVARSAFAIGYSQWMEPVASGERRVLPGHNTVVRRSALLAAGAELEEHLRSAAFLSRFLVSRGCRGYLAHEARMRHFDSTSWRFQVRVFVYVGVGFGAMRTRGWPRLARLLYPLAAPAAVVRHYARASRQLRRVTSWPPTRPGVAVLAVLWGLGEGVGALLGVHRAAHALEITEIKPVTAEEIAAADAYAAGVADTEGAGR